MTGPDLTQLAADLRELHQQLGARVSLEGRLVGLEAGVAQLNASVGELKRLMERAAETRETQGRQLVEMLEREHGFISRLGEVETTLERVESDVTGLRRSVALAVFVVKWAAGIAAAVVTAVVVAGVGR